MRRYADILYRYSPVWLQNLMVTAYGFMTYSQRYGGNFLRYVSELEESQWFSRKKLEEIQEKRTRIMIEHVYENVPYYRNLFNKRGLLPKDIKYVDNLKKIPILEKQTLRERRNEFIAQNISRRKLIPYPTGGTTGTPLTIYTTKDAIQYNFACSEARVKRWAGVKGGDKIASFVGRIVVPVTVNKPPFWRYNKACNQIRFSVFHMNDANLQYYVAELNRFRPRIIDGYPSPLRTLANYILDHGLEVYAPKAIITSSETLFKAEREIIEKAFKTKVFDAYSLAEFVSFISECENGRFHMSPEYGMNEFKKIDSRGEKYEIIATSLFNFAMPLIRYRTGDVITLASDKECLCGRKLPLIGSIEGRTDGMLITPEGNHISPAAMSLVFQSARNIKQSQIIQTKEDRIIVRIVKEKDFSENDLNYLLNQLKIRLGKEVMIDVEAVSTIERTKGGKFRFIVSRIPNSRR